MLQPDGSYKCKVCVDFFCCGRIPMEAHLKGKPHLKNLMKKEVDMSAASTFSFVIILIADYSDIHFLFS